MLIDKAGIAQLIPHAGEMCLLDGVLDWTASRITCTTCTHLNTSNPLRRSGQLGILCGVEYAAQAMAVHAALTGGNGEQPRIGYLASLRGLSWDRDRLDLIPEQVVVEAEQLHGEANHMLYTFALRYQDLAVLSGRAAVAIRLNLA